MIDDDLLAAAGFVLFACGALTALVLGCVAAVAFVGWLAEDVSEAAAVLAILGIAVFLMVSGAAMNKYANGGAL